MLYTPSMNLRNREERRVVRRAFRTGTVNLSLTCGGTGPMAGKAKDTYKINTCMTHGNAACVLAAHRRYKETGNYNSYVTSHKIMEAANDIVEFLTADGTNSSIRDRTTKEMYDHMVDMEQSYYALTS